MTPSQTLIGDIYDCIDHPEGWQDVLTAISRTLDCSGAINASISCNDNGFSVHNAPIGVDDSWMALTVDATIRTPGCLQTPLIRSTNPMPK